MNNPPYGIKPSAPRWVGKHPALGAPYDFGKPGEMGVRRADTIGLLPKAGRTVSLVRTNMNRTRCVLHGTIWVPRDKRYEKGAWAFYAQNYVEAMKGMLLFACQEATLIEVERRRPRKESITPRAKLPAFIKIKKAEYAE